MVPRSLLKERFKNWRSGAELERLEGICPVKVLDERSRYRRYGGREEGTGPVNMLLEASKI
jgi:hypothetical protein